VAIPEVMANSKVKDIIFLFMINILLTEPDRDTADFVAR
jgi:hypothetical protein